MEEKLTDLLQSCKIFSFLDKKTCQKLLPKLRKVILNKDEILFYQGEASDSLYFLASGELVAILTTFKGENQAISYLQPGEVVGELGALSEAPRTLTIKAVKDSVLFKLSAKDFIALCYKYPAVMFEVINPIILRSQKIISMLSSEKSKKQIVIMPASKKISLEKFSKELAQYIETLSSIIFLSDYDSELSKLTPEELTKKIEGIERKKKANQVIVYFLKSANTPLAAIALQKQEMLYIVGSAQTDPHFERSIIDVIKKYRAHFKSDPQFILLHGRKTHVAYKMSQWLKQDKFSLYHHVRMASGNDYRRLLRFIRGRAIGLVLSGGGTRGFGHVGAIKALREAKIPIDIIGGTSVGAIVAGCYATTQTYQGVFEKFSAITEASRKSVSWRSLTWPLISIFNAKRFTVAQRETFNSTRIEDLPLPYFCVSTNLAKNVEQVHQYGFLWKKTRASSSIPGLIPPMVLNGEMHVDGALLNNLPVDVMRHLVGVKGKIIAIELGVNIDDENAYKFPPIITFWKGLLAKLKLRYKVPRFVDTFFKALLVGSLLKSRQNGLMANVLVNLDLSQFGMLHVDKEQAKKIIDIGYKATMEQIKTMKPSKRTSS